MTEERFEQIIEGAADRFDKSINRAWRHWPVRFVGKSISFLTGAGLVAGAIPLAEKGNDTAAKACLIGGALVIACGILELVIFRKK